MNIHRILNVVIKPFRKKRMTKFLKVIDPQPSEKILDVGGTIFNWKLIDYNNDVVLLNLSAPKNADTELPSNISFVVGDGTALQYDDKEFAICFSNSVIFCGLNPPDTMILRCSNPFLSRASLVR